MAENMTIAQIQFKRGTAQRLINVNPLLNEGEPGFEYDTYKLKIGDGIHHWNELPYIGDTPSEGMTLTPVDGSLIIKDNTIDIGISAESGNILAKKADGLYVSASSSGNYTAGLGLQLIDGTFSIKLAENTNGLTAVNGALAINIATKDSNGAMSKEDKAFIDTLKELDISNAYASKDEVQILRESVERVKWAYTWEEI